MILAKNLSDNNKLLLLHTHEHRLVQLKHLHTLLGGSEEYLGIRVKDMVQEGYLEEIDRCEPLAYQLGKAGQKIVASKFGIDLDEMRFKRKPTDEDWIDHQLLATKCAVSLRKALKGAFDHLPIPNLKGDSIHEGRRLKTHNVPDYAGLTQWKTEDGTRLPAYLEAHTGHMPIYRSTVHYQQSIYKKLLGYLGLMHFKGLRFFVLTVTKSPTNCMNMPKILYPKLDHLKGDNYAHLVLFNHEKNMETDPVHTWINLAGEQASLLPEGR